MSRLMTRRSTPFIYAVLLMAALLSLPATSARALDIDGFVEGAYGYRTGDDTTKRDEYNLLEGRLQFKGGHSPELMEEWYPEVSFKVELLADGYDDSLELILREGALSFTPSESIDVKVGRQTLTWGTGDLLFINDLFPKDYVSFFIGRDSEYLKVPSDAVKVSLFVGPLSLDFVATPVMEPNNSVTGERISFYDGLGGRLAGEEADRKFIEPPQVLKNAELALRAYGSVGRYETALYLFRGFYKEPRGIIDPVREEFFYPRLNVYGASIRGPVLGGIGNVEMGYYDSREDGRGDNPLIENSSVKYLLGYTRDMGNDGTVGFQYFVEQMADYSAYLRGLGAGEHVRDEYRHLVTVRLSKLFKAQTVEAGLFVFYSPSDEDAYFRPSIAYKVTDNLSVTGGANVFTGRDVETEFGQFERNDNLYTRVRYLF